MKRLPLFLALAAVSVFFVPTAPLEAKDDPAKMKKAREKVRAKIVKDGGYPFYDLRYYVDAKKLSDTRWSQESLQNKDHKGGAQLLCKWTLDSTAAGGLGISVVVFKHLHKDGEKNVTYSIPFKHWGESVPSANMSKVVEGYYEDWKRQAQDIITDSTHAPKKARGAGPAKEWACVVGTNPESKEREYRAWYGWTHGKDQATYICRVRVGATFLKKQGIMDKGTAFVKQIKEVKGKVKW